MHQTEKSGMTGIFPAGALGSDLCARALDEGIPSPSCPEMEPQDGSCQSRYLCLLSTCPGLLSDKPTK